MVVGAMDSINLLVAKKRIVAKKLDEVLKELRSLQKTKDEEEQQMSFLKVETLADEVDKSILELPVDSIRVKNAITTFEERRTQLRKKLEEKTNSVNPVTQAMLETVRKYMIELGDSDAEELAWKYLFTSNLKILSGAVLHKTVFSFRLAYIKELEKKLGIKLPILLDSPKGKEIDDSNVQKMMSILQRDFSENQIIIASIYQYNIGESIIRMSERLLDQVGI